MKITALFYCSKLFGEQSMKNMDLFILISQDFLIRRFGMYRMTGPVFSAK